MHRPFCLPAEISAPQSEQRCGEDMTKVFISLPPERAAQVTENPISLCGNGNQMTDFFFDLLRAGNRVGDFGAQ